MAYAHIPNLYRDQRILAFTRCFALEKVHGTSAHIALKEGALRFFAGGAKYDAFVQCLGNTNVLLQNFLVLGHDAITVYGEAYGGKMQGMRKTYGDDLRFIAFDVRMGKEWLSLPLADAVVAKLGLEFVPFAEGPCVLEWLDAQRDAPSVVAVRRGIDEPMPREGIVIRPPFEACLSSGERICAKHKRPAFCETRTPREIDPAKVVVLQGAKDVALEWVTEMRLSHVLDRVFAGGEVPCIEKTGKVVSAMVEDVEREGAGEVPSTREVRQAIGKRTAELFKARLRSVLSGD
jgi:hypothetical protein